MLRSSVLEESLVMKMSLRMKSYGNLMTICIAMSQRKLIYGYLVSVQSIPLVWGQQIRFRILVMF